MHLKRIAALQFVQRYLSADVDDFREEFPRLPPDANPLDPRFADPQVLAGRRIVFPAEIERRMHPRHVIGRNAGVDNQRGMQVVQSGNLDPNLPLMQLFFASFLPWNSLDTSRSSSSNS
jgi:hypothetical protein